MRTNASDNPVNGLPSKAPSAADARRNGKSASRRAAAFLAMAALFAVALGVAALECGLYKAFDDNSLKMDSSAARSALALWGVNGSEADVGTSSPATAGPAR